MVLPLESAEQNRRRILETCQNHIRRVLDSYREFCLMLSAYQNGDENEALQHYNNTIRLNDESTELKRVIMKEVSEVGMILLSREDFIRLSSEVNTIADYTSGASFRLAELANRKLKINNEIMKELAGLAEATLDCIIRLRETILSLSYGGSKTIEMSKHVEAAERTVDAIYRKVDLKIINSDLKLPQLLMMRDIAEFLEGIADVCENACDIAKTLSITI